MSQLHQDSLSAGWVSAHPKVFGPVSISWRGKRLKQQVGVWLRVVNCGFRNSDGFWTGWRGWNGCFLFKQGTALKAFVYFTTCLARVSLTLWHKALAVVSKGSPLTKCLTCAIFPCVSHRCVKYHQKNWHINHKQLTTVSLSYMFLSLWMEKHLHIAPVMPGGVRRDSS